MLFLTFFAHANDSEPGSQYLKAAEAGDRRAQYFLADSWFSSGDLSKAEYWAQKAADSGDADACALLAQIKITNPVSLDYPQAKVLAEKAAQAGSKEGEVTLAHILVNTQAGKPDYPKAISLLENASEDLENDSAVDAQMLLGLIYANGVGIKADDDKATWYFKRSSAISRTFDIFPESAVTIDCTIESIKLLLKIKITEFIIHYIFLKCNYYYIKLM